MSNAFTMPSESNPTADLLVKVAELESANAALLEKVRVVEGERDELQARNDRQAESIRQHYSETKFPHMCRMDHEEVRYGRRDGNDDERCPVCIVMDERDAALRHPAGDDSAGWMTIESAPKDGTWISLFCDWSDRCKRPTYMTGRWRGDCWRNEAGWVLVPTHWMPLPPPPGIPMTGHAPPPEPPADGSA